MRTLVAAGRARHRLVPFVIDVAERRPISIGLPETVPVQTSGPVVDFPIAQIGPAFAFNAVQDTPGALAAPPVSSQSSVTLNNEVGPHTGAQGGCELYDTNAIPIDAVDYTVVYDAVPVRVAARRVEENIEFDAVERSELAAGAEPCGEILDQQVAARVAVLIARTKRAVIVEPQEMIATSPRSFAFVRRRPRLAGAKCQRPRPVTTAPNTNRPGIRIDRQQLDLFTMVPVVMSIGGHSDQCDVVVRRPVTPGVDVKDARIGDVNYRLARLGRNIACDQHGAPVDPVPREILVGVIPRVARVAVEMQQHHLVRMRTFELREEFDVARFATLTFFIEAFADDALQAIELPVPVGKRRIKSRIVRTLDNPKEKRAGITVLQDVEVRRAAGREGRRRPDPRKQQQACTSPCHGRVGLHSRLGCCRANSWKEQVRGAHRGAFADAECKFDLLRPLRETLQFYSKSHLDD